MIDKKKICPAVHNGGAIITINKFWHILKYGAESTFGVEWFLEQKVGVTSADVDQENLPSCLILFTERKHIFHRLPDKN